jgi:alpha-tubulin suppressor-like RCC1 family protein
VGIRYACARHSNGGVWCWGENVHGQLGTGDTGIRPTPNPVNLPAAAQRISAKFAVSCATLVDGSLRCWGENAEGQMGQNDPMPWTDRPSPVTVPKTEAWQVSASGQGHVCGLQAPGSLWCWGRNALSVLGTGTDQPGQIRTPTRIGTDADWSLVSSGQLSNCGIRSPGTLWCWGDNSSYALGLGDTTLRPAPTRVGTGSDWMSVSVDTFHGCGIRRPGTLWCWGRNDEGQVGMPFTGGAVTTPTRIGTRSDWAQVSVGRFHSCARATDQTVWCTGDNPDGRLGTGNTTRPYAFTAIQPFP